MMKTKTNQINLAGQTVCCWGFGGLQTVFGGLQYDFQAQKFQLCSKVPITKKGVMSLTCL